MTRLLALALAGACATPARPTPTPAPAPPPPPPVLPRPVTVAPPTPPPTPPSPLELATRADLTLLSITKAESCPDVARTWIVSALDAHGGGATCLGDGSTAPRCVMFAGTTPEHLDEVMCAKPSLGRPVPTPAWAPDVLAALGRVPADQTWQVTPIQDASNPAIAIQIDDALYVAIKTADGWQRSREPVDRMYRLAAKRVLDTSPLTGAPSFGVITSSYDGGSESGTETTTLTVVRPSGSELAEVAAIQVGQFTWILPAEDRRKYPAAATSLDARPRVEVQLVPTVSPGVLSLSVGVDALSKELAGRCMPNPDDEDLDPPCIRAAMKARAGRYRLGDEGFTRVPASGS